MRVDLALDVDGGPEGVAMQASALVPGGNMGQAVGGLEGELFEQFHEMVSRVEKAQGCISSVVTVGKCTDCWGTMAGILTSRCSKVTD
jgi:hypothetical protein